MSLRKRVYNNPELAATLKYIESKRPKITARKCIVCNGSTIHGKAIKLSENAAIRLSFLQQMGKAMLVLTDELQYLCSWHFNKDDLIDVSANEALIRFGVLQHKE